MIKLVVFDFDGVFTDGKITFDNNGYACKYYNAKDGNAIFRLKDKNIFTGVISGWKNNTSQKCILEHLKFDKISLGSDNKLSILHLWTIKMPFQKRLIPLEPKRLTTIQYRYLRRSLEILHENGICHGDLPGNVMMDPNDGMPRIIDWENAFYRKKGCFTYDILHLWTFKTTILKSLGNYCFINYYSFINFI